jgi:flagellar biosynthesis component FlhA
LLIVTDILVSVTVLMVSLYLVRPVEFTSFPTTLLLLTLFRLALNISSRLILLNGNTGTSAAGEVIGAFGSFVVGGNYIIGAVIFLVLIAIQYVVINHGAVRISEVTARFTLDALPGKQMSIDSDLNAGLIDEPKPSGGASAGHRSRVLRRHGRRLALHPARRRGQHSDHGHQHYGRLPDRRAAARDGSSQGA